jgi:hypothetical protein
MALATIMAHPMGWNGRRLAGQEKGKDHEQARQLDEPHEGLFVPADFDPGIPGGVESGGEQDEGQGSKAHAQGQVGFRIRDRVLRVAASLLEED